jgi:restriction system protein
MLTNVIPDSPLRLQHAFVRARELDHLRAAVQRSRVVAVLGPAGIGKTTLVRSFEHAPGVEFPGGVNSVQGFTVHRRDSVLPLLEDAERRAQHGRSLLIIDGLDELPAELAKDVVQALPRLSSDVRVVLTSRGEIKSADLVLRLAPLSPDEGKKLLEDSGIAAHATNLLTTALGGLPLALDIAARAIREGQFSAEELLAHLRAFSAPGVLGPDGSTIAVEDAAPALQLEVIEINDQLLRALDGDISIARALEPKKFEQLVAEIMTRMGYTVELTPASRDGGKDIYAVKRDDLGTFLYVVECKRYAVDHPVGVQIVRSLYGTVQAERATAGILVTTSVFTKGAKEFQRSVQHQLSLRDYAELHRWIQRVARKSGA